MKISIFGLGYVGAVTAGCLVEQGHTVVGVDVQAQKVESLNRGVPPIIEPELDAIFRQAGQRRRLRAVTSCAEAITATELSIVCVGTPSTATGELDLTHVRRVLAQMGRALARKNGRHVLVIRSTMLPGSTAALVRGPLAAAMKRGQLAVCYYPEFLREGTAVADFRDPALTVVGTREGGPLPPAMLRLLGGLKPVVVDWATAEMVKYACNAFHATKVVFANEIGRLSKQVGVDSRQVMSLLCADHKLNLSPYYLRPGNPFGGSCLPKDVRAVTALGRRLGVALPLLEHLVPSNERHLQSLLECITRTGVREVAILGLSFKSQTDDLRESSMVEVAQTLLGRGYALRVYDPALNLAALVGSNRRVIDSKMPHLASLLKPDLATAIGQQGLLVVAQRCASLAELAPCVTSAHRILDVNGWPELQQLPAVYEGFCW